MNVVLNIQLGILSEDVLSYQSMTIQVSCSIDVTSFDNRTVGLASYVVKQSCGIARRRLVISVISSMKTYVDEKNLGN